MSRNRTGIVASLPRRAELLRLRESERRYAALVNAIDGIVWEADARTFTFLFVSDSAERILGYPVSRWREEPDFWKDHIDAADRDRAVDFCKRATAEGRAHELEYRMVAADGRTVWLRDIVSVVVENGQPVKLRGVMVDTTEQKNSEQALGESEARFRSAFKYSAVGMALLAFDGTWLKVNDALCEIVGYRDDELMRTDYLSIVHPEDRVSDLKFLSERLARGARSLVQSEKRLIRKDGSETWAHVSLSGVTDSSGEPYQVIAQIQDISERRAADAMAAHLALHDPLTALPNKRLLSDRLAIALSAAKRSKTYVGVLFIDLDGFKPVNDTWGHEAGDAVLRQIAQRLQSAMRQSDTVSRVGGDEFVVLATAVEQRHELDRLAERLLVAIERPCEIEGGTATVSASIGIAIYPDRATDPAELIRRADAAMYEAKRVRQAR